MEQTQDQAKRQPKKTRYEPKLFGLIYVRFK